MIDIIDMTFQNPENLENVIFHLTNQEPNWLEDLNVSEISPNEAQFERELGVGAFGAVCKGLITLNNGIT